MGIGFFDWGGLRGWRAENWTKSEFLFRRKTFSDASHRPPRCAGKGIPTFQLNYASELNSLSLGAYPHISNRAHSGRSIFRPTDRFLPQTAENPCKVLANGSPQNQVQRRPSLFSGLRAEVLICTRERGSDPNQNFRGEREKSFPLLGL